MPMSFPDLQSLKDRATQRGFRQPNEGETEDDYREALAEHVGQVDMIESMEIRHKVGWDQWSPDQELESLSTIANKNRG